MEGRLGLGGDKRSAGRREKGRPAGESSTGLPGRAVAVVRSRRKAGEGGVAAAAAAREVRAGWRIGATAWSGRQVAVGWRLLGAGAYAGVSRCGWTQIAAPSTWPPGCCNRAGPHHARLGNARRRSWRRVRVRARDRAEVAGLRPLIVAWLAAAGGVGVQRAGRGGGRERADRAGRPGRPGPTGAAVDVEHGARRRGRGADASAGASLSAPAARFGAGGAVAGGLGGARRAVWPG